MAVEVDHPVQPSSTEPDQLQRTAPQLHEGVDEGKDYLVLLSIQTPVASHALVLLNRWERSGVVTSKALECAVLQREGRTLVEADIRHTRQQVIAAAAAAAGGGGGVKTVEVVALL